MQWHGGDVSNDDIVRLMVGRELQNSFNAMKESTGNIERDTVFEVNNVTSRDKKKCVIFRSA